MSRDDSPKYPCKGKRLINRPMGSCLLSIIPCIMVGFSVSLLRHGWTEYGIAMGTAAIPLLVITWKYK